MDANTPPSVKERPIIFSAAMVRAILEGRKTQTRRVVKLQPEQTRAANRKISEVARYMTGAPDKGFAYYWREASCWNSSEPFHCPYGQPGDRLWVRETHALFLDEFAKGEAWEVGYKADLDSSGQVRVNGVHRTPKEWRPSIHMPRWASRILLEVVSVRVERLQEISGTDAVAEGCGPLPDNGVAQQQFADLWSMISGQDSWYSNPWVWVVEFKRVDA